MKHLPAFTLALFCALVFALLGSLFSANAAADWSGQYLMVDQNGNIQPSGYAAGLQEIAEAEAQAAAAEAQAQAVQAATAAASNVVDQIVASLTGSIAFGYVTGHTVSLAGVVEVSTNASASIVFCQFGAGGSSNISAVAHTGHYIWHAYSEPMNAVPAIKYKTNLNATNAWEFADWQSTAEFQNTTVNGTLYETVYRSTVWLPASLDSAFFLAFCEIIGGGSAGGAFDVIDGFSIGGKVGYTGQLTRNGYVWTYQCGALMSVEVAP